MIALLIFIYINKHNKNMTVDEQLDKLGSEYKIEMEKARQLYFIEVLVKLTDVFKCTKMINDLNEAFPMIKFLEAFYNAGFYKGLNYGFESKENMIVDDIDIPIKYSKEIEDEINREILEGTSKTNI